jgi:hypothetical protein
MHPELLGGLHAIAEILSPPTLARQCIPYTFSELATMVHATHDRRKNYKQQAVDAFNVAGLTNAMRGHNKLVNIHCVPVASCQNP